jgi:hypothetical protein
MGHEPEAQVSKISKLEPGLTAPVSFEELKGSVSARMGDLGYLEGRKFLAWTSLGTRGSPKGIRFTKT